jgi:hypothetical protein
VRLLALPQVAQAEQVVLAVQAVPKQLLEQ